MGLDSVNVVHELEDALGAAAHDAREIAGMIRRVAADVRLDDEGVPGGTGEPLPELLDRLAGGVEAIARHADLGPDSALTEWRRQDDDPDELWLTYPTVAGAFWPCASGGDYSRAWVERVDDPDEGPPPFECDDEAAWAVALATGWPLRYAELYGALRPYVQPFDHDLAE